MSLFDERDMAAITSPDYPGERLIVCRNPDLARERARKREDLLAANEKDLAVIAAAVRRASKPLRGEAAIALKVGAGATDGPARHHKGAASVPGCALGDQSRRCCRLSARPKQHYPMSRLKTDAP